MASQNRAGANATRPRILQKSRHSHTDASVKSALPFCLGNSGIALPEPIAPAVHGESVNREKRGQNKLFFYLFNKENNHGYHHQTTRKMLQIIFF